MPLTESQALHKLRQRVLKFTQSEDLAQDACLEWLSSNDPGKCTEWFVWVLSKRYRSRNFYRLRTCRETPVSQLTDHGQEDFLSNLSANNRPRQPAHYGREIPAALHEVADLTLEGLTFHEMAARLGVTYNALTQKLHYYKKKFGKT